MNAEMNWKPMEFFQDGRDVVSLLSPGHDARRHVLNMLKAIELGIRETVKHRIAIV